MRDYFDGPRFRAQLVRHLPGGKSLIRIAVLKGISPGYEEIEVPTDEIPADLREVGSLFLVLINPARSTRKASAEDTSARQVSFRISRLPQSR